MSLLAAVPQPPTDLTMPQSAELIFTIGAPCARARARDRTRACG